MIAIASIAQACPLCGPAVLTQTEQIAAYDVAIIGQWVNSTPATETTSAVTTYRVEYLLGCRADRLKTFVGPGSIVEVNREHRAAAGQPFLLFASDIRGPAPQSDDSLTDFPGVQPIGASTTASARSPSNSEQPWDILRWQPPIDVSVAASEFLAHLPPADSSRTDRLAFFADFLEHPDSTISNDAYAEFASAPYDDVVAVVGDIPVAQIRQWVQSTDTLPNRLGLYGLMLGMVGDENDQALLAEIVFAETDDFRLGIDGLTGGYLLLSGAEGLTRLEKEKLARADIVVSERFAAANAIRFLWTDVIRREGEVRFTRERVRQAARLLLDTPETATQAIADLARWSDWSQTEKISSLYGAPGYNDRSMKQTIIRFLISVVQQHKAGHAGQPPASTPTVQRPSTGHPTLDQYRKAETLLNEIRESDPRLVARAERLLFLEAPLSQ